MKKALAAIMTVAMALSSSLTAFAAPETIQMEELAPLPQNDIVQNNTSWTSLPETAYNDCFRKVIDCLTHGHPLAEYSYNKDNTLNYWWYSWEYDANGNPIAWHEHDKKGKDTRIGYQYDAYGRLIATSVGDTCEYDENGRLIAATCINWFGEPEVATYEYDANGNLTRLYPHDSDGLVINSYTIQYEYDENGNLTAEYYDGGRFGYITYEYNADGNLVAQYKRDPDDGSIIWGYLFISNGEGWLFKQTTTYSYDERGNRTAEYRYNDDGSVRFTIIYEYDANGNRIKSTYFGESDLIGYTIYKYADN